MAVGFQSFRDNGTMQVDGDSVGLVMVRKFTAFISDVTPSGGNAIEGLASYPLNSGEVLAIRPLSPANVAGAGTIVGTPSVLLFSSSSRYGGNPSGTTVECFVFSSAPFSPSSSPGLQVFRSDGALSYDSGTKPLHIVDVVDGEGDFTYQSGRVYASIHSSQKFVSFDPGGSSSRVVGQNRTTVVGITNGIRVMYGTTGTLQWPATSTNYATLTAAGNLARTIICDVTNY